MPAAKKKPATDAQKELTALRKKGDKLAKVLQDAHGADLVRESKERVRYQPRNVYASQWHPCTRNLALNLLRWENRPPFGPDALNRMEFGVQVEDFLLRRLSSAGRSAKVKFTIAGQQERIEIKDRNGRVIITGKKDCSIVFGKDREGHPTEVKWGDAVRNVTDIEGFARSVWARKYPYQLLAYLYGKGIQLGFMLLPKMAGLDPIPVVLEDHLDKMEDFVARATEAMDSAAKISTLGRPATPAELEQFLPLCITDAAECGRCWHYNLNCFPATMGGLGGDILPDDIEEAIEMYNSTRDAHLAHTRAGKRVKEATRGKPIALAGKYYVEGKWQGQTVYTIPDKIKAKYQGFVDKYAWKWTAKLLQKRGEKKK